MAGHLGIEIKNSILLVDFTNQLREHGMGLREAIVIIGRLVSSTLLSRLVTPVLTS